MMDLELKTNNKDSFYFDNVMSKSNSSIEPAGLLQHPLIGKVLENKSGGHDITTSGAHENFIFGNDEELKLTLISSLRNPKES